MAHQLMERLDAATPPHAARDGARVTGLILSDDDVRRVRRWLLVSGVLSLLAGAATITVPAVASVTITIFVGWILLLAGVVMGIHAFSLRAGGHGGLRVLSALLALVVGIYLVAFPLSGAVTLTFLLAVWFFGMGALDLITAWQMRGRPGTGIAGLSGALAVALGVLVAAELPSSANWAIGLLVGINLILWGERSLVAARLLTRGLEAY
jgi:uncharacterized membrane protein HdeD (DUF308 family)